MHSNTRLGLYVALPSLALLAACGSGRRNASPRLSTIPGQVTAGGTTFSVDLKKFVTDRENDTLSYTVKSGGGSFAGSVYSNMFDTLGTYTVEFNVSDTEGKTATGSFTVKVTTATLAVIQQGSDLMLLDTATQKFVELTNTGGVTYTFKASLPKGQVVFERTFGGRTGLYVHDPNTGKTTVLGESKSYDSRYAQKTGDHRIVFTRTSATDTSDSDLFIWDSQSGLTREISAQVGEFEGNPMVTSDNLVFYEQSAGSQRDIYYFDPTKGTVATVSKGSRNETLQAVAGDDAVLFTHLGAGGEKDLFRFKIGAGLVELGVDLGTAAQSQSKTYKAATSDGKVVYELTTPTQTQLYVWDPSTGGSRRIGNEASNDETFVALTPIGEVVYDITASPTNNDLKLFSLNTFTFRTISTDSDNDVYHATLSNGDVVFRREVTAGGHDLYLFDTSAGGAPIALATTGNDDYVFGAVLKNGKIAYTRQGASGGVFIIEPGTLTVSTVSNAAGATYAGEGPDSGDVVATVAVGAQNDLVMWDESAGATVTVSSTGGDDAFGAALTESKKILFTRVVTGQTNKDLFVWDQATAQETRLTTSTEDNSVVTVFDADNS